jgi:hypothetical protein
VWPLRAFSFAVMGIVLKVIGIGVMSILRVVIIIIVGCMVVTAEAVSGDAALSEKKATVVWRESFTPAPESSNSTLPKDWLVKGKPGTLPAAFSMMIDKGKNITFLHMEADRGSASLITNAIGVDLSKTPILRWRWRVTTLPEGADGRIKTKDDQAIGIYVGTGSNFSNKSVSYRWDTETPKGAEGNAVYGLGTVKVKWYTVKNKEDASDGGWFTEERNVAEDFRQAWGFYPEKVYISVSCNSQYTGSQAAADLGWIEFVSFSAE